MRLWHDPQHGGDNRGCEWGGIQERKWVVGMATDLLPSLGVFGCEQRLARDRDVTIPYEERAETARQWGARLALLHHVNAMVYPEGHELAGRPWPKFDGLMTFALGHDSIGLEVAKTIGRCAPRQLVQGKPTYVATPHDWTVDAYRCLIHYGRVHVPAVLIEWGFATSPTDSAILQSDIHRPSLCAAAAAGIGRAHELL